MKKRLLVLTVLALCSVMLFANGGKETAATAAEPQIDKSFYEVTEPIEIVWWHALENQYSQTVDEIVESFNNSQSLIKVKAEYIGNYATVNESLVAAQAAGTGLPAVVVANTPYVAQYGASGLCEDLNPYAKATGYDFSDFGDGMMLASSYDGKQVALPFLISTQVMYYNKDMAKAKGVEIPAKFKDMDEFLAKVSEFNADGTTKVYGTVVPGWDQWYFETFFLNNGSKLVNDDNASTDLGEKAGLDTTKAIANWINKGYAYFAVGKDASSIMRQNFIDQKAFSVIHTSSLYNTYVSKCKDFEVGMAWLPAGDTKNQEIGGCVLLIPAKNDQKTKNAAWQFLSYLCSKDVNMKWADETGYMPTRKSVLNTAEGQDFLQRKPAFKCIFDNLDYINPRIQHPSWNEFATIWKNYLAEFYIEKNDIDKGVKDMVTEMDEVLED
jgi:ABC-type sugar transport system, periplasmic component